MDSYSYASRKTPEFMCHKLVKCESCEVVYALSPPDDSFLLGAYSESDYDSDEAADCAAWCYNLALEPYLEKVRGRCLAVDVGAGNGALLPYFMEHGFAEVMGIEPSLAAIQAARKDISPHLRQEMFTRDSLVDGKADLICSFMTLEHLPDPGEFVEIAYEALAPGGLLAVVVHDYDGLLNRMLGKRSPIIDLEHLQLFNKKSIEILLKRNGFKDIAVTPLVNRYPLHYWLRLVPIPKGIKNGILGSGNWEHLLTKRISFNVGNIFAVGYKE